MTSRVTTEPAIFDVMELTSDPELKVRFAESAHQILADLVSGGAALGWVDPPSRDEVAELLGQVVSAVQAGDAALRAAYLDLKRVKMSLSTRTHVQRMA